MKYRDAWKMERIGDVIQVKVFDLDGTPFIDREVDTFMEACLLIEEFREQVKDKAVEQVNQYDTAFWLHADK